MVRVFRGNRSLLADGVTPRMTRKDYHLVMSTVSIAELKARLSHYVRIVHRGGSVTVLNRSEPVARLVPVGPTPKRLSLRPPKVGAPAPGRVPLPPRLRTRRDVVELLLEERQSAR